jgi:superoxide reductase
MRMLLYLNDEGQDCVHSGGAMRIGELYQEADWQKEKHVPVIECADAAPVDEMLDITISLGKAIAHPNTTEHHIDWIELYFKPDGDKFAYQLGRFNFTAHGACAEGPNLGPVYTNHSVGVKAKFKKSGTLVATSYCNIHGLWESSKSLTIG